MRIAWQAVAVIVGGTFVAQLARAEEWTTEKQTALDRQLDQQIRELTRKLKDTPDDVALLMARGTAHFWRGRHAESVTDFDRTIALDPAMAVRHWQRGLSLYFAGRYDEAADQFERYHAYDNVDRENGIWRFLSQVPTKGIELARKDLLRYEKTDREPFPDLYRLYQGTLKPEEVLVRLEQPDLSPRELERRKFYAHLYLGYYELARGDRGGARRHLQQAVNNAWGQQGQGGPGYMWHVARLEAQRLAKGDAAPPPARPL